MEIAELNNAIQKMKSQKRLSNEYPLTMQQLEECNTDVNMVSRAARGLSGTTSMTARKTSDPIPQHVPYWLPYYSLRQQDTTLSPSRSRYLPQL